MRRVSSTLRISWRSKGRESISSMSLILTVRSSTSVVRLRPKIGKMEVNLQLG